MFFTGLPVHGDVGGGYQTWDLHPLPVQLTSVVITGDLFKLAHLLPPRPSFCPEGGSNVTIIHCELDLTVRGLPTWGTSLYRPLLVTSGCHHWGPVQTSSLEDSSHQYRHLGATETVTVGKWAVCILECLLGC